MRFAIIRAQHRVTFLGFPRLMPGLLIRLADPDLFGSHPWQPTLGEALMTDIRQTRWVNVSNVIDKRAGISRFVKTLQVPHPKNSGDVVKLDIEAVTRRRSSLPPEHCLSEAFENWLQLGP